MSSARGYLRSIITELFPWLERFGLTNDGKDLEIKSASDKILLAGGDAPVGRVGDGCTRLIFYPGIPSSAPPVLYQSTSTGPPYIWTPVANPVAPVPTALEPGTQLQIIAGSERVSSG